MEVRAQLDALDRALEGAGEEERRSAAAGGDVEDTRPGPQAEPPSEQDQLLLRDRVLELVPGLGDDEVARDRHAGILPRGRG